MKKVICAIGVICLAIGLAMWVSSNMEIAAHTRYTWEKPYTQFEAQVLATKYIGIVLLISGAVDILLTIISTAYTSRTIQDKQGNPAEFLICPKCHCKTITGNASCPNCNYKFDKDR